MFEEVFIIGGVRTPIGHPFKSLKDFKAAALAALTIKEILKRNKIPSGTIDEVIMGNTVSAGTGQNLSRQASRWAGLSYKVPALTINNVCGAGLQAVVLAAQAIRSGEAKLVLAGGTESATYNPSIVRDAEQEKIEKKDLIKTLIHDGLWCHLTNKHMGELAEALASEFKISRKEQDQYTIESHRKARQAQQVNKFREILSVPLKDSSVVQKDDRPRANIDLEKLTTLPPTFKKNGTVTAGNSSIPCDGAACVLVATPPLPPPARRGEVHPRARIISYATIAIDPKKTFTAAIVAVKEALRKAGLSLRDIDLFEVSESFAVQAIVTRQQLKIPEEKMNIWGGDVALGHPLGAAGARVLVTLLHALADRKKRLGVATVCFGGGGGVAMVVERM